MILDSGCTVHICTPDTHVTHRQIATEPITITIPDGSTMTSTHEGHLDIPALPPAATHTHIVPELNTHSLISLGQLCDAGCTATVDKDEINVSYNNNVVLTGHRSNETTLWHLKYKPESTNQTSVLPYYASATLGTNTTKNIIAFFHAAMFSPTLDTLHKALKLGYITNIPGVSAAALKKYPPFSAATIKGHLDQTRKNIRSTKVMATDDETNEELFPIQLTTNDSNPITNNYCYTTIFEPTGKVYSDQTGNFQYTSLKGNNALVILYDYDSNAILAEPISNRKAATILEATKKLHNVLRRKGRGPQLHILDNECSDIMKNYFNHHQIKYQLAAPGQHRTNAAERAIRTFKNHFIAGLCSIDDNFPINLWDRLLPQAIITINLLRGSRINPKHSAWSQLFGPYDFNKEPIAPPGIRVLVHVKPDNRTTWAPHAEEGWYIGPAQEHYRCYRVYMTDTKSERITDTISWYPTKTTLPTATSLEIVAASLQDVQHELLNQNPPNSICNINEKQITVLKEWTNTFQKIIDPNNRFTYLSESDDDDDDDDDDENKVEHSIIQQQEENTNEATVQRVQPCFHNETTNVSPISQRVENIPHTDTPHNTSENAATMENSAPMHNTDTNTVERMAPDINKPHNKESIVDMVAEQHNQTWPVPRKFTHQHFTRASAKVAYVLENAPQYAFFGNAINPDSGKPAEYLELSKSSRGPLWVDGMSLEIGKLLGTETIRFIPVTEIPTGTRITYAKIVCADRPEKENPIRVRLTIGGNLITYDGTTCTKAAEMPTVKIFINSVLSTPHAKFMTLDLKDFYLNTARMPDKDFAYMKLPTNILPPHILNEYKQMIHKDHIYVEVSKGIYGLPQAGKLANEQLIRHLAPYGYAPCPITPGLWKHETRDISFLLVVDDFGVKYTDRRDVEHLLTALQTSYKVSIDWEGERYCGLILKWEYQRRTCDISMPGYIERALARFDHPKPKKPQDNPFKYIPPEYGAKVQYAPDEDTSELLDEKGKKRIQEILGTLLYYARAVDPTILVTISHLSSQQAKPTVQTMAAVNHLLDYCATHPNAISRFHKSDMVLHVESDASYLSEPKAKSRYAGYHYLSIDPKGTNVMYPPLNAPVLVSANIIKETVASAAEAELAGLFHNGQDALPLIHALNEIGHPQPPTPIQTDNSTAAGLANDTVKQKRSKAMEMRYFWIVDKVDANVFNVYWNQGKTNRADYYSKQHPTKVHRDIRPTIMVTHEHNHTNYYEAIRQQEIEKNKSTSKEGGKGVLISESGLHAYSVSLGHQLVSESDIAQADLSSEFDRFSTQFTSPKNVVVGS
jgi:hypothetical protein